MHNIHIIIVNADNHKEAEETAISSIESWGDENNWRTTIGSFDKSGKFYKSDNDRFNEDFTLGGIIKELIKYIKSVPFPIDPEDYGEARLYREMKNAEHAYYTYMTTPLNKTTFWETEIYAYKYDEFGITNLAYNEDEKSYAVLIDMHS